MFDLYIIVLLLVALASAFGAIWWFRNTQPSSTPMSNEYKWDLKRPEANADVAVIYNVQVAKQILFDHPRSIEMLDLRQHGDALRKYLDGVRFKADVDWNSVNTDLPAIFARTPSGRIPIDGRHRLKKAIDTGLPSVPIVYLSEEETNSVRVN